MKKFTTLLTVLFIIGSSLNTRAQEMLVNGGFENWSSATQPDGWNIAESINQESNIVRTGDYSARHTAPNSGNQRLQQVISGIEPGTTYTLRFYYLDDDNAARTRIWSYWLNGTTTLPDDENVLRPASYSQNNPNWQEYTAVITAPANADGFRFEVRSYAQDGSGGGFIYFDDFSFSSDVEVKPEPSNYPTAFASAAEGFGARLSWTDAVGEQLPDAYLILGAVPVLNKSVHVNPPQDGVPVPDNLDISLGYLAMNVAFGVEEYLFQFLEGNTDYHFVIYPYTNSGPNIDYKTDGNPPETLVTTNNFSMLLHETFDEDLGQMTAFNVVGEQEWVHYTFNNDQYARINGFAAGQSHANEDWLISPPLNLSNHRDVKLNFRSGRNFEGPELQLMISQNYDGSGNPNSFSWVEYTDAADWSAGNYEWVNSGTIALNITSETTYIAFKYTSTTQASAVWQVDDIMVYGEEIVGLNEIAETFAKIWPNPAAEYIVVESTRKAKVLVTDLKGSTMLEGQLIAGKNRIDIANLAAGSYVVVVRDESGNTTVSKLLKQ
jgi:hypothetical protein